MPPIQEPLDRHPLAEIAKRAAEGTQGLYTAALAVGVEDHRRMLKDHAERLKAGFTDARKASGFGGEKDAKSEGEGDEMGDIIVTGDNHYHLLNEGVKPAPSSPAAPSATPSGLSPLAKGLIATALATSGLGAAASIADWLKPAPAAQVGADTDTTLGIQIPVEDRLP